MKTLLKIFCISLVMGSLSTIVLAEVAKKEDSLVEIKITKNTDKNVEAQIVRIGEVGDNSIPQRIKIIGQKKQVVKDGKKITDIVWNKVADDKNTKKLRAPLRSSIVAQPTLEKGDQFKAKGSKEVLIEAIQSLATTTDVVNNSKQAGGMNDNSLSSVSANNNTSKLSSLASVKPNAGSITSSTTGDVSVPIATTSGCSVRVDYQLNKVFTQQRMVDNGSEVDSCRDTSTYFDLLRDYDVCPAIIDENSIKSVPYFQYFYNDDKNTKNLIDQCQPDVSKAKPLQITKVSCEDYVDIVNGIVYPQEKQYYKDADGKDVLLTDCAVNRNSSYRITEDMDSCGLRNDFVAGYSVQRSRLFYTKDGTEVEVQPCQDTSTKYTHNTTTNTCSSVVVTGSVTIYTRKYITINNVTTYVSACEPSSNSVNIQSEDCTTTPFTHDFAAGQSYKNKNYFYLDGNNSRVEVSSCIKSQEAFPQMQDTSVCVEQNDDTAMATTIFSRKYITVNSNKIYISDCAAVTPSVPYSEVGYKWIQEYALADTAITATGVSDNVYKGSAQGEEVQDQVFFGGGYTTKLVNAFDISKYTPSCSPPSSYVYSGSTIDLSYSRTSSILYNNYVSTTTSAGLCYNSCSLVETYPYTRCYYQITRQCNSAQNTLYYQRCNNYRCPVNKFVKKALMRRKNGTELLKTSGSLATKYTCGDNGLNNTVVYY